MNIDNTINSEDILNAIDLNKINHIDKKKRGRPKKSQQLINPPVSKMVINDIFNENEEIILHLPISHKDIQSFNDKGITINDMENTINKIQNESEDNILLNESDNDSWSDVNKKQY